MKHPAQQSAEEAIKEGKFIDAVKFYQQVIDNSALSFLAFLSGRETSFGTSSADKKQAEAGIAALLEHTDISATDLNGIGIMYHNGDGINRDYAKAMSWYEKAKAKECAVAYRNIGILYEYGLGVEKNVVTAARYYQQALERGYVVAATDLDRLFNMPDISAADLDSIGVMYANADRINRDYVKALRWQEKAKAKEYAAAYRNIGILYESGHGVEKNVVTAARHYQQAVERGYAAAATDLNRLSNTPDISAADLNGIGIMYHNGDRINRDYASAMRWYEKAKEYAAAYRNIGILYEYGLGVEKNVITAARYYQQAVERGYAAAATDLDRLSISAADLNGIGIMYYNGDGINRDYASAMRWYEKAKAKEYAAAYRNIGVLYEYDHGVEKNVVTAARYYQQAVERGYAAAATDLDRLSNTPDISAADLNGIGMMYRDGDGINRDYASAMRWYEKAKAKEYAAAYRNIGVLYEYGHGVEKNVVTAARHYQQAVEKGADESKDLDRLFNMPDISTDDLNRIGVMYRDGESVTPNPVEAQKWSDKAADLERVFASFSLAVTDLETHSGVIVNHLNNLINSDTLGRARSAEKNNQTWLHLLSSIPHHPHLTVLVPQAARKVLQLGVSPYSRSTDGQTPFQFLQASDPYQLIPIYRMPGLKTDFIGVDEQINQITNYFRTVQEKPDDSSHFLLLSGPPGVGKTVLVERLCQEQKFALREWVRGAETDIGLGGLETRVQKYFRPAVETGHSICLFIDEMDAVVPAYTGTPSAGHYNPNQLVTLIQIEIDKLKGHRVILIGATNYLSSIKLAIRNRAKTIHFELPSAPERRRLIEDRLRMFPLEDNAMIEHLVAGTSGWSPRIFEGYFREIEGKVIDRESKGQSRKCQNEDFVSCFDQHRKTLVDEYRALGLSVEPPKLMARRNSEEKSPERLVLGDDVHRELRQISNLIADPTYFTDLGISPQRNVLLYGPPGTGKTSFAAEIASRSNATFITLGGGAPTPEQIEKIFEIAKSFEKAVVFLDEIDSMLTYRATETTIQTQMEGIKKHDKILVLIAATNYRERLSEAMLSRFHPQVCIPLPNEKQRAELFQRELERVPMGRVLSTGAKCLEFAQDCEGFSPRDICKVIELAVCQYANEKKYADEKTGSPRSEIPELTSSHISKQILEKRKIIYSPPPSLPPSVVLPSSPLPSSLFSSVSSMLLPGYEFRSIFPEPEEGKYEKTINHWKREYKPGDVLIIRHSGSWESHRLVRGGKQATPSPAVSVSPKTTSNNWSTLIESKYEDKEENKPLGDMHDQLLKAFQIWDDGGFQEAINRSLSSAKKQKPDLDFEAYVKSFALSYKPIQGDGKCFCRAVYDQLQGTSMLTADEKDHTALQSAAIQYILDHVEEFKESITGPVHTFILRELERKSEWADHHIIHALAKSKRLTLVILNSNQSITIFHHPNAEKTVYLSYKVGLHYDSAPLLPGVSIHTRLTELISHSAVGEWTTHSTISAPLQEKVSTESKMEVETSKEKRDPSLTSSSSTSSSSSSSSVSTHRPVRSRKRKQEKSEIETQSASKVLRTGTESDTKPISQSLAVYNTPQVQAFKEKLVSLLAPKKGEGYTFYQQEETETLLSSSSSSSSHSESSSLNKKRKLPQEEDILSSKIGRISDESNNKLLERVSLQESSLNLSQNQQSFLASTFSNSSQSTVSSSMSSELKLDAFKMELKSLLKEEYQFSIKRPSTDTLLIEFIESEAKGSPETIQGNLDNLIKSLRSAIAEKDIKENQYEMNINLEEGKLTIREKEPNILNRIAELLEQAGRPGKGTSYFKEPLSQVKAALFWSKKSKSLLPESAPEPIVTCLIQ